MDLVTKCFIPSKNQLFPFYLKNKRKTEVKPVENPNKKRLLGLK